MLAGIQAATRAEERPGARAAVVGRSGCSYAAAREMAAASQHDYPVYRARPVVASLPTKVFPAGVRATVMALFLPTEREVAREASRYLPPSTRLVWCRALEWPTPHELLNAGGRAVHGDGVNSTSELYLILKPLGKPMWSTTATA